MKKIAFGMLAVSFLWYACARQAKENTKPTAVPLKLITHKEAIDSLRRDTTAPLKALEIQSLSDDQRAAFFSSHDLSGLFFDATPEGGYANRFDGFYGNDYHRIEFYFSNLKKDSLQPHVYHVSGKNRFKNNIIPFEGTLAFQNLSTFKDPNLKEEHYDEGGFDLKDAYTAEATFELKEEPTTKASGVFSGKMLIDFFEKKDGNRELWYFSPNAPAQASGFKFEGTWRSYQQNLTKPVVWAKDLFAFANQILTEFSIGEREVEINKKYRHLGWENYWENDEWWHDNSAIQ